MADVAKKKILLIDDNEMDRQVYSAKLQEAGYAVETAVDGEEGLAKMKSFLPDLVLLDMFMPKMTGFDVVEAVRECLENRVVFPKKRASLSLIKDKFKYEKQCS